jgi:hypothetical protein
MWDENLYPKTEIQRGGIIQSILSEETHDIGQQQTGKINYPTHEEEVVLSEEDTNWIFGLTCGKEQLPLRLWLERRTKSL